MARTKTRGRKQTVEHLKAIARLAADVERTALRSHAALRALVRSVIDPNADPPNPSTADDGGTQGNLGETLDDTGSGVEKPCKRWLDAMAAAARRGDRRGAARAYENYVRCIRRPRRIEES
jgi:hypothetical protein